MCTALSVILGLMSVVYVLRIALGELKLNNFIILALSFSFFMFMVKGTNSTQTYNEGYNDAIHDAELIEITNDGYYINFNGEIHSYTFD